MLRLEYPPKTVWSVDLFGLWYHCPQKPRLLLRDGEDILRVYRHFDARYSLRTDLAHGFLSSIPNLNPVAQSLEPWIVLLIISLILVGAHVSMRTDYIVHSTEKIHTIHSSERTAEEKKRCFHLRLLRHFQTMKETKTSFQYVVLRTSLAIFLSSKQDVRMQGGLHLA